MPRQERKNRQIDWPITRTYNGLTLEVLRTRAYGRRRVAGPRPADRFPGPWRVALEACTITRSFCRSRGVPWACGPPEAMKTSVVPAKTGIHRSDSLALPFQTTQDDCLRRNVAGSRAQGWKMTPAPSLERRLFPLGSHRRFADITGQVENAR